MNIPIIQKILQYLLFTEKFHLILNLLKKINSKIVKIINSVNRVPDMKTLPTINKNISESNKKLIQLQIKNQPSNAKQCDHR